MAGSNIHRKPRPSNPSPTLRFGDRLGEYIINGFAGKGATSYVYRARHESSFEPVAIKVLHPHLCSDEIKRTRFLREATIMMGLDHPNVVEFKEIIELPGGGLAFVMEYIEGLTMDEWIESHGSDVEELTLACVFVDVLRGLGHAHRARVVHRDLKPANILITHSGDRHVAKIIDFGVARRSDQPTPDEDRTKIVGTAAYISPEEVRDPDTVCPASDLYSIGVMMYEAACGRRPFEGLAVRDLMKAHAGATPDRPRQVNPELTPEFENVILRTLGKTPDERYESAPDMISALELAIRSAMEAAQRRLEEETAQTEQWDRAEQADEALDRRRLRFAMFFRQAFFMALTFLVSSGQRTGDPTDPHHLNRVDSLHVPFG